MTELDVSTEICKQVRGVLVLSLWLKSLEVEPRGEEGQGTGKKGTKGEADVSYSTVWDLCRIEQVATDTYDTV